MRRGGDVIELRLSVGVIGRQFYRIRELLHRANVHVAAQSRNQWLTSSDSWPTNAQPAKNMLLSDRFINGFRLKRLFAIGRRRSFEFLEGLLRACVRRRQDVNEQKHGPIHVAYYYFFAGLHYGKKEQIVANVDI